jgi:alanine racemase
MYKFMFEWNCFREISRETLMKDVAHCHQKGDRAVMHNEARRAAWVEIDLGKIRNNFSLLRTAANGVITIPAIKADAYGHGAVKVGWELVKEGTDFLGVATLMEAVELRLSGIQIPIVLFSLTPKGNVKDILDLRVIPVVSTFEDVKALSDMATRLFTNREVEIFIALETGMGRVGFMDDEAGISDIAAAAALPGIRIKGLFSHFATSDEEDQSYALAQIERFDAFESRLIRVGVNIPFRTMANSGGILNLPQAHFEAVRPGIALYGQYVGATKSPVATALKPAMSVKANIVYIKEVPSGFDVSYGRRWQSQRSSRIGTLPLGYADGLPRMTTGSARVIINGVYAPIIGSICMDQCMVDLTEVPNAKEYDEAIIMGAQNGLSITAEEIAKNSATITYEVICRFGQRLPKVYV